jgi:hypothetical protein
MRMVRDEACNVLISFLIFNGFNSVTLYCLGNLCELVR